jgi:hypothetical protein
LERKKERERAIESKGEEEEDVTGSLSINCDSPSEKSLLTQNCTIFPLLEIS